MHGSAWPDGKLAEWAEQLGKVVEYHTSKSTTQPIYPIRCPSLYTAHPFAAAAGRFPFSQSFRDGNYPSAVEERYIKGFGGRDQLHYADQFALNHAGYSRNLVQVISTTLVCRVI